MTAGEAAEAAAIAADLVVWELIQWGCAAVEIVATVTAEVGKVPPVSDPPPQMGHPVLDCGSLWVYSVWWFGGAFQEDVQQLRDAAKTAQENIEKDQKAREDKLAGDSDNTPEQPAAQPDQPAAQPDQPAAQPDQPAAQPDDTPEQESDAGG